MPEPAEVERVVFRLDNLGDAGMAVHVLDEGIVDDRPEPLCEGEKLIRCQVLVFQDDDEMVEKGVVDFRETLLVERPRQIRPTDNRAEGAGDRFDSDGFVGHGDGLIHANRSTPL